MASFFGKLKTGALPSGQFSTSSSAKKDANGNSATPLEKLLLNAGPIRDDGSDKFFGYENFGSTCYCNSIIQCLYYSNPFREHVVGFPRRTQPSERPLTSPAHSISPTNGILKSPQSPNGAAETSPRKSARSGALSSLPVPAKAEDKESPEYKKKLALASGPVLNVDFEHSNDYGMNQSLFTSLKDIFEAIIGHQSRMGVVSPNKFLEILRRDNEMFRTAMHQDAHEFLNILLNQVVESVEEYTKKLGGSQKNSPEDNGLNSRWVHELFEGTLTSETRCLTCENLSQRDEVFLDLSVDLEQHSSVTSCLRKFSEEEMLCERNKFHCDNCGGLQEAEKRMKIKKLPRILALHLKRFKYTEDLQRLQKLFHRVVFPYHLRLFNTTDDAEDPDRLYELYAVVVHIGGGPYHGHYVSIVKTQDRGWLLFDDEMVEPLNKGFIRNFFGSEQSLACAYILFYQETTLENLQREQDREAAAAAQTVPTEGPNGTSTTAKSPENQQNGMQPIRTDLSPTEDGLDERLASLDQVISPPSAFPNTTSPNKKSDGGITPSTPIFSWRGSSSKEDKTARKEEKARKAAEKEQEKVARKEKKESVLKEQENIKQQDDNDKATDETNNATRAAEAYQPETTVKQNGTTEDKAEEQATKNGSLGRLKHGSRSLRSVQKFWVSGKDRNGVENAEQVPSFLAEEYQDPKKQGLAIAASADKSEKTKGHRFGLGKKKSTIFS